MLAETRGKACRGRAGGEDLRRHVGLRTRGRAELGRGRAELTPEHRPRGEALGANHLTMELPTESASTRRIGEFAAKRQMLPPRIP